MARSSRWAKGRVTRRIPLRKALFVVPNAITLASIFCGFNAMVLVSRDGSTDQDLYRAALLLVYAMFFDLIDGRVARLTKTQSAFGLQIDSLADVMSFGVAPALLMYKWVLWQYPMAGLVTAFAFVACGAIRLARFNVLSSSPSGTPVKPGRHIVGLPIPPAAGVLISLVLANHAVGGALGAPEYTVALFTVTVVLSFLMVSTVKFRSFKDLKPNASGAALVLFALGSSAFVWQRFRPEFVLVWLLAFYVLIGFVETARLIAQRLREGPARDSLPPAA